MKSYFFNLKDKNNPKKIYKGFVFSIYRLKLEFIFDGKRKLYRIEWNDWNE